MTQPARLIHARLILSYMLAAGLILFCPLLSHGEEQSDYPEENRPGSQAASVRTPLAGEGFSAEFLGRQVEVPARDRTKTSAWDLGFSLYIPPPEHQSFLPIFDFYLWRHPPDSGLFRAQLSGVYNEVLLTRRIPGRAGMEWGITFNNLTIPFAQAELIDGRSMSGQELVWGYVRPGFGIGYRTQIAPGHQDNMAAALLTIEPGYLLFKRGSETDPNFRVPQDTVEVRGHLQLRWDAFDRNLLELPHRGFAAGADAVYGSRLNWENWGENGSEQAGSGAKYTLVTAYALAAGGLPGIASEKHRILGSVHAGIGRNLDRFSAQRIGGGPEPMGEEFEASSDPVLPGAAMQEFFPHRYAIATVEYRWEPVFFAFLCVDGTIARLDRLRITATGTAWKNDTFTAIGTRLFTGFFFNTRLQLGYHYNFSVLRNGERGGQEVIVNVSRNF